MKGLFIKDLALILQRKRSLLILLAVIAVMAYSANGTFIIGYVTIIGAILANSTLNYDEFDNGMPFLMSLPTGRTEYVKEKYLFSYALGLFSWLLAASVGVVSYVIKGDAAGAGSVESIVSMLLFIPVFVLVISLMLPLQLKFGPEKSRIILLVIFMCFAGLAVLGQKISEKNGSPTLSASADPKLVAAVIIAAVVFIAAASYAVSLRIIKRKEF